MATTLVTLHGYAAPDPSDEELEKKKQVAELLGLAEDTVELHRIAPQVSRDANEQPHAVEVKDDDIVTVDYENGARLFFSGADFVEEFSGSLKPPPFSQRSTVRSKGNGDGDTPTYQLSSFLPPDHASTSASMARSGGPTGWVLRSIRVTRIAEKLTENVGYQVCRRFEDKMFEVDGVNHLGLRSFSFGDAVPNVSQPANVASLVGEQPILVLIHGTGSHTRMAFREFWNRTTDAGKLRESLNAFYKNRVVAFEHRTLTEGPIENAIELAKSLPDKAVLHVVSHSRGGLIGELLCRAQRVAKNPRTLSWENASPFTTEELGLYDQPLPGQAIDQQTTEKLRDQIHELNRLLEQKQFRVRRFLRVACPARGTTLASGKLDRWLSCVTSLLNFGVSSIAGKAFGAGIDLLSDLATALIKTRTRADVLPGLEAMMPSSRLIRIVSNDKVSVCADLSAVSGQLRETSFLSGLTTWFGELFYGGPNDGVVNTGSMYSGALRVVEGNSQATRVGNESRGLHFIDPIASVGHSSYFGQAMTAGEIVARLTARDDTYHGRFRLITDNEITDPDRGAALRFVTDDGQLNSKSMDRVDGTRPVVVILPGIMGSHLKVNDNRVWADVRDLAWGGMAKLKVLKRGNRIIAPAGTGAEAIFQYSYGRIAKYLGTSHHVVPFEYDWRLSVVQAADTLAMALKRLLEKTKQQDQPIRILAHSMGGLVARALMIHHPDVWEQVCARRDSHTVMLGTPLFGSFGIVDVFTKQLSTLGHLATLDLWQSEEDLIGIVGRFPGMLQLLPQQIIQHERPKSKIEIHDFFDIDSWRQVSESTSKGSVLLPDQTALLVANEIAELKSDQPDSWDVEKVFYVHGQADETPAGYTFGKKLKRWVSKQGDNSVLWDLGNVPLRRWWMNTIHGNLADHPPAFPAIRELLELGRVSTVNAELRESPFRVDASRGDEMDSVSEELRESSATFKPAMLPTDRQFQAAALWGTPADTFSRDESSPIKVSIVHADLAFSRHPVLVGHYVGDPIIGAEKKLDEMVNRRLSIRQFLGGYPGEVKTNVIELVNEDEGKSRPRNGAIVVGLGNAGELNASELRQTLHRAFLDYAMKTSESVKDADEPGMLGVSTVLIGTGADSLPIYESLSETILAALSANRRLRETTYPGRVNLIQITEIEFVELFHARAALAMRELRRLKKDQRFETTCDFDLTLHHREGGQRQLIPEEAAGWWHRILIEQEPSGAYKFTSLTRRAIQPVRRQTVQRRLIRSLIQRMIRNTANDDPFRSAANALFQELVPIDLKDGASQSSDLVLVVDKNSAAIPWEALIQRQNDDQHPLSVQVGMLRALQSHDYRNGPRDAYKKTALVIGDPISEFVELPGAQKEAKLVADILSSMQYQVDPPIRKSGTDIVCDLRNQEYRILHLAGHGVYEFDLAAWRKDHPSLGNEDQAPVMKYHKPARVSGIQQPDVDTPGITGMVLGGDIFLTPEMVRNTSGGIPELVFINCCHLGHVPVDNPPLSNYRDDYHELAANLALQFIGIGVRAVVAAGWAVNDDAAYTFAGTFYESLLRGRTFGEAVKDARNKTYTDHESVNTYAAYQCYGDPGWRLQEAMTLSGANHGSADKWNDAEELLDDLYNLAQQASAVSGQQQTDKLIKKVEQMVEKATESSNRDHRILAAIGLTFAELGDFVRGGEFLERACKNASGPIPIAAFDRRIECRYRLVTPGKGGGPLTKSKDRPHQI
ncbi:MAG: CHAT domain-containing protein [Pirellulaceae bacterium]